MVDVASPITLQKLASVQAKYIEEMEALSPHGRLKTLTTPVYLLHGEADTLFQQPRRGGDARARRAHERDGDVG